MSDSYDAIVVGSGPNGLAAAITLSRANLDVLLIEGKSEIGGGLRTEPLTLPGFLHDACSAIHPLAVAAPFFQTIDPLAFGLEWIQPEFSIAHPLENGHAVTLQRSLAATARGLGPHDGPAYERLLTPLVKRSDDLISEVLQPMLHLPRHPLLMARFGVLGLQSAYRYCTRHFTQPDARALFAGMSAHSFLPLTERASAAMGLILNVLGHSVGWPLPRGGSGNVAAALARCFELAGGKIETNHFIANIDDLPKARAIFFDVPPRRLLALAEHRLPARYCTALRRFKCGPGVFKLDYALNAPIPWRNEMCGRAGTVHVGGTLEEIAASEDATARNEHSEKPFVLVTQPSRFDPSRAPAGKHVAWAYCHVPNGSTVDMTARVEAQIERFAPGFRDCILRRATRNCRELELANPNLIGGDISGGRSNLGQLIARPVLSTVPYKTPLPGVYLCSSSTPPGGGVHGMCGHNAAQHALKTIFKIRGT